MIQHDEKHKEVIVSNAKMAFRLNYEHGILLSDILHVHSSKSWLAQPVAPFILTILGQDFSAADFSVEAVHVMKDLARECVSFDLKSPAPWALTARVSLLSQPEDSWILLYQMGAKWPEDCPQEVFMHIPWFKQFGSANGKWYLSSQPETRPDGTSVMQLHDEFDLPICNIAPDQKTGFSMEFRDIDLFANAWNQMRNCDLLHTTREEQLKDNRLLLRLQNEPVADVFEARFFALDNGWCEAFDCWRDRIRAGMDLTEYQRPDLQWYRKVLYQHFTFAYSREVFDYETQRFDANKLLKAGLEFGGYDSVLLWYQYPRLGVDERKQWDFNRDIPGGMAGMRSFTQECHKQGVRVFLPYKPWDVRYDETPASLVDNIVEVVRETEIDGIWFDTMDSVPEGFREKIDAVRPGVLFCTEVHPALIKSIETITGHWDQFFDEVTMPHCYLLRYLFPENNAPITSRWKIGESKDMLIDRAIFNGTGFAIWQDIFGAWLPFSADQRGKLKRWKSILLEHFDTYFCSRPIPLYPVQQHGLYANRFCADDGSEAIYSLYNASELPIDGTLLVVEDSFRSMRELWANSPLSDNNGVIQGRIDPGQVMIICRKN